MKKSKYRRLKALSFILSVIMIICSIPMTATAEPVEPTKNTIVLQSENDDPIIAESFEMSDPTLDWQGLPIDLSHSSEIECPSSNRSSLELPAGIYSFQNVAYTDMWIDTRADSYNAGTYIQQYTYAENPADTDNFIRAALFKITKHPTYGTYIIRSMLNNRMSIGEYVLENTPYIKTYAIELNDADVPIEQTFNIDYYEAFDGFTISPYNSDMYIASQSSTASGSAGGMNSCLLFDSLLDIDSLWSLTQYSGSVRRGHVFEAPSSWTNTGLINDTYYDPRLVTWSTQPNHNTPYVTVEFGYEEMLYPNWNWNPTAGRFAMTTQFPGELQLNVGISFSNASPSTIILNDPTYRIVPQAGDYYIQNAGTLKYMYTSGTSASTSSNPLQYEYNQSFPLMVWEIQHVANSGGYVRIKSKGGNVYLGVNPSDSADIVLSSTLNNYTLWKIDVTSRNTLVFMCKAIASTGYVMWAPNSSNGAAIQQTTYVNDSTNLKDEWYIVKNITSTPPRTITKDTVYSGNLNAGELNVYYFTPSYSGLFTVETFGTTDTYGEISGNVGTSSSSASDDDSGTDTNFAIGFYQSAGNTTTIIVRHYNSSTGTGSYTLQVRDQRAQIYTFYYPQDGLDTTNDSEEPLGCLQSMGYSVGVHESKPVSHINETIATTFTRWNSEVIFFSGHGGEFGGSLYFINSSGGSDILYDTSTQFTDMTNTKVAVWAACNSTVDPDGSGTRVSIAQKSINMGARSAIGWDRPVYDLASKRWTDQFFLELENSMTVTEAAASAGSVFLWPWEGSYAGWEVLGDGSTLIAHSDINTKSSHRALDLYDNSDYSNVQKLIESGNYKSFELKGLGVRYYKTINGCLTNEFYDVYDTGMVKSSGETFTPYDVQMLSQQEFSVRTYSPKNELSVYGIKFNKLMSSESYTVYMKMNNEITPIMITYSNYKSGDGAVYQDVECINLLTNEYIDYMDICTG